MRERPSSTAIHDKTRQVDGLAPNSRPLVVMREGNRSEAVSISRKCIQSNMEAMHQVKECTTSAGPKTRGSHPGLPLSTR